MQNRKSKLLSLVPADGRALPANPSPKTWDAMSDDEREQQVEKAIVRGLTVAEWQAEISVVYDALANDVGELRSAVRALQEQVKGFARLLAAQPAK